METNTATLEVAEQQENNCEKLRSLISKAEDAHTEYPADHKWLIDNRDNQGLHALYIKWAISGILAIDQAIKRIEDEGKTSHCGILLAMFEERAKLIMEDAAYWAAYMQLRDLVKRGLLTQLGDIFIAKNPELEEAEG